MITLAIILTVLIIILLLRFGVRAEYSEEGVFVVATVGLFSIKAYPRVVSEKKAARKAAKKALKEKKTPKEKKEKKPEEKKAGGLDYFFVILSSVKTTLGRLRRRLLIKRLTIRFVAANEDPSKTAMVFGGADAVFGAVVPVLENCFRIRRRDFVASADFNATKPKIYLNAAISLALWEALYIAIALLPLLTKRAKKSTSINTGKDGLKNG